MTARLSFHATSRGVPAGRKGAKNLQVAPQPRDVPPQYVMRNRRNEVPTDTTSIPSCMGSLPPWPSMYARWTTSSSESPSTRMEASLRSRRSVSHPDSLLK